MAEEYYTFNETLSKLGVSEDELLNLVSSGQLRAFRINHDTKFRIEDVDAIGGGAGAGSSAMAVEESSVVELDDLPDDVVLMEDDSSPQLSMDGDLAEETVLADDSAMNLEDSSADDLMIFDESEAAPLEEAAPMELSESSEVMDLSDSAEIAELGESALDLSEEDSDPALAETVVTDSSAISGTEDISLDDDDIEFSTQEITVQEDAISEDEVSAQETVVNHSDDEDFTEEIDAEDVEEDYRPRHRRGAGAPRSAGRRHMQSLDSPKGTGDLLFNALLGVTVIGMIYPILMMSWLLFFGATTGRDMISVSEQKYQGKIENISPPAVPGMFEWIVRPDNALTGMVESTKTTTGLSGAPGIDERKRMIQTLVDAKAAAPAPAPVEEAPAPIEDAEPVAEPEAAPPAE